MSSSLGTGEMNTTASITWVDQSVYSQQAGQATNQKSDYLRNAYYYLSHRKSLLSLWQNLSYQDSAFDEAVPTDSIPPMDLVSPSGQFRRERAYLQWDCEGHVTSNIGQLYEHAEFVKPLFLSALRHVAADCNLTVREPNSGGDVTESGLVLCPMKMAERAAEKAREEYSKVDPGPPCAWIYDILRASFVCDTEEQIRAVYEAVMQDPNLQVIRVKNRFQQATAAGYRDVLMNVMFEHIGPTNKPTHFICEIVITHIDLWQYEIENDTRSLHKYFRKLTAGSPNRQEAKLRLLEQVVAVTSPILNAVVSDTEIADDDISEAVRALCQPAFDKDDRDTLELWVDVLDAVAELELEEKFLRRLIKLQIKRLGDKNLIVADLLVDLGSTLRAQGQLEQAAMVYQAAAVMKNEILGENDPQVADALFCMAEVRTLQGKYQAAVPLHEQALVIRKRLMYGRDQADIAVSLTKLAEIMEAQDNHAEAISYYTQALAVWHSVYGENSPFVAACMNSLALLLDSSGRSNEAKGMFERCVAICKVLYSEDHTSVASAMNNLALCLKKLGDYEAAHHLYEQALAIRRARYGEKHPAVATTLNNLGLLLKQQQRYEEAKALYLQALQIRRELFGTNHVDVAASLSNLALLHEAMGSFNEALVLHEQALAIRVSCLGPEHELVAETLVNIGLLHKRDRNIEDARAMFERAIEIYNLMPGMVGLGGSLAMHPDLAAAQAHLVALNEAIDDQTADVDTDDGTGAKGAITIVSGTRRFAGVTPSKLYVRVHRAEHEKLALSLRSMALALQSRGEADGARPFLEQSLGLLLAVSSGRPDASELCTDGIVLLALLYRDLGRNVLCHDLLSRALVSYTAMFKTNQCPKVVDTMRELGKTSNLQQEFSGSKQMLSDALRIAKDLFSVSCVEVSSIILEQGISARDTNELERSKELFEECLQMRISSLGDGHPLVAGALVELGQVYRLKGSFTRARECYEVALKIYSDVSEAENGRCNKEIALIHRRIGLAYKEENTWVLAFSSLQKSVELYSSPMSGLSMDSLELASTLYEAAHVAIRLSATVEGGGLENAVGMLSRCLEIREKRLGRFHRDTHQTKLDLAIKLRMNAKNVAVIGKNAYYRSHAVGGKRYGSDEEYIQLCAPGKDASFDSSLAIILLENAADAFEQANLDSETSGNRDSYNLRELANVYVELGGILVEEQMWLTAAPVYEKLLDTYRRIYSHNMDPTNQRELIADRHVLALLDEDTEGTQLNPLLHRGSTVASSDLANGEPGSRAINRIFHPDMRADSDETATALATAAFVCMRCNRLKRAKDLYLEAIEIHQRIGQGNSLAIADVHSNFGEMREREKKYNKAKEQHMLAHTIRLKVVGDDHPLVADSLEELGQLRLQGSKWDKAEKDFSEGLRIRRGYAARMRRTGSGAIKVPASYTSGEKRVFAQATWEAELAEADGRTAYSLCDLAFAYTKKKDLVRARDLLQEALMLRRDVTCAGGFNGVLYSAVAVQLAQILVDLNSFEDAQLLLVEALRLREDYFGPSHRLVVEALQLLAVALDKMDRTADAQRILERALSILVQLYRTEFNEDIAKTYSQLGMLFFKTGDYPLSITYFKKALEIWMKRRGIESGEVTDAMLNLAFAFKKNNEPAESRNNYEQAAAILRRRHGYNHPDVASVLASLSSLSFYERRYEEALDYSKQVLRIRKRLYGRDNAEVINTTANQAIIYEKLLMNKNAHKLHIKVLQWREQHLQNEDILLAFSLIAVSDSFRRLGEIEEAFSFNERALSQLRVILGHSHEATIQRIAVSGELYRVQGRYIDAERQLRHAADASLVASNNEILPSAIPILLQLAGVTRILGKYVESERWYRSVLSAQESQLGRDSIESATTLSALGVLLMEQYKLKEANNYLNESLTIRTQVYGDKHPDVASSLNNIGSLLDMLGRHEEAKAKFEQALQIRVEIFGSKHPSVAQSLNNIGALMSSIGRYDEAETLFNLAHSIITKLFGVEHPEGTIAMNNLAGLLDIKGEFVRSLPLHEECLQTRKDALGQGHLLCAQSMNNIGSSMLLQSKLREAAAMYQEAVNIRRRVHGNDHNIDIAEGFSNQASVYMGEGRYQIAAKLQRQASQIMEDILGSHHPYTVNVKGNLGISCRRNGETSTGNELLREAAEFLTANQYPYNHPWVIKFSNEARAHGDYGGPALGQTERERPEGSAHGSSGQQTTSSRMKDVQKHKPVRLSVDRDALEEPAARNDDESVGGMSLDSYVEQFSDNRHGSSGSIDSASHRSSYESADVYHSQQSRGSSDPDGYDSDSVDGQNVRDGEVVRVVKGKNGKAKKSTKDADLPLLPRMLARIPFLSKKSTAKSGALETDEEVNISRVVKKKGPYQPGAEPVYGETPERPLVPRRPEEALPLPPFASGPRAPKRGSTAIGLFGSIEDAQELQLGTGDELSSEQRVLSESDDSEDSRRKPPLPPNGGELTTYSPFNKDLL